jgi:hypothetical protein
LKAVQQVFCFIWPIYWSKHRPKPVLWWV